MKKHPLPKKRVLLFFMICSLTAGCATLQSSLDRGQIGRRLAERAGLEEMRIETGTFVVTAFRKPPSPGLDVLRIYIEGDGRAWISRHEVSADPTPAEPVALELAIEDPSPGVVYLARPCQYTPFSSNPDCGPRYWTSERYSAKVVDAMSLALDRLKEAHRVRRLELVGYSGGGAIAVLLAARRDDVRSLRTVCGNLDPDAVNRHHGVDPLEGSLDPIDYAVGLADLPQLHFVGGQDRVVPTSVAEVFIRALPDGACAERVLIDAAGHHNGWKERWRSLLDRPLPCAKPED